MINKESLDVKAVDSKTDFLINLFIKLKKFDDSEFNSKSLQYIAKEFIFNYYTHYSLLEQNVLDKIYEKYDSIISKNNLVTFTLNRYNSLIQYDKPLTEDDIPYLIYKLVPILDYSIIENDLESAFFLSRDIVFLYDYWDNKGMRVLDENDAAIAFNILLKYCKSLEVKNPILPF